MKDINTFDIIINVDMKHGIVYSKNESNSFCSITKNVDTYAFIYNHINKLRPSSINELTPYQILSELIPLGSEVSKCKDINHITFIYRELNLLN